MVAQGINRENTGNMKNELLVGTLFNALERSL